MSAEVSTDPQAGISTGAGAVGTDTARVTLASDDPAVATLGATTGAAVITDANGTIQQYLRGLIKQWIAGTLVLASRWYTSPVSVVRPANADAYTAGDVVGGAISFPSLGLSGEVIQITSVELEIDVAAIPSGMTSFALYLYSVTPPSALADNAVFDLASGDRASFLGKVTAGTPVDEVSTLYVRTNGINAQMKLAGTGLFGYLVTAGGYTPAGSSETYKVTLHTAAV